jgi:selenocysteine-specific elongation factor
MPIVGTAGHVDHGKSTLVRALTGTDPDRWDEEKRRGLTIDLGFAWARLGTHDVGFVDVPGHERFVKNMLAGVGAVDCTLFVVAADSGWMPQTEEHASVLDLLDVRHGVIALTRTDLVDRDTVELAMLEIIEEVEGTTLEGWPIVAVSVPGGRGLDELRDTIVATLDGARPTEDGPFRMWIDRSFTIDGAGRVVTGTILSGSVGVGDELTTVPDEARVRVRGLQHHGGPVTRAVAGSRTAINISGDDGTLERGHVLVTPGSMMSTRDVLLDLVPTRTIGDIPDRGAFHLHIGTASRPTRLRTMGAAGVFIARLDDPVAAAVGDRVIIRDSGRRTVVGGGRVLDPMPAPPVDASAIATLRGGLDGDAADRAEALLLVHGSMSYEALRAATGGGLPTSGIDAGDMAVSDPEARRIEDAASTMVMAYHHDHPARPGFPKAELASRMRVPVPVIEAVVGSSELLEEADGCIRTAGFAHAIGDDEQEHWRTVRTALESSFDVPRLSSLDLEPELVHFLMRRGDLVRIGEDLAFTDTQIAELTERVAELPAGFTVSAFRDHFGMSRRQAVPMLEWLDRIGRTRRSGDGRTVR